MRRYSRFSLLLAIALTGAIAGCGSASEVPERSPESGAPAEAMPAAAALPGLEVLLRDSLHLVRGRRVGFLTNQTAVTSDGRSGIDLLHEHPEVELVALYGPEHGLRGGIEGGVRIDTETDAATGLPIYSLYGQVQRPTPAMLEGVEVLLFDMQDIGARPYTFVWTMAMAMEAAAAQGIPFIVLDRPNPITARAGGPVMEMEMRNVGQPITGYYPVPLRHGMTVGERHDRLPELDEEVQPVLELVEGRHPQVDRGQPYGPYRSHPPTAVYRRIARGQTRENTRPSPAIHSTCMPRPCRISASRA